MSQDVLFRLEPYAGKLACTVLRGTRSLVTGLWGGNAPRLPDLRVGFFDFSLFPSEGKKSKNPTQLLPLLPLAPFWLFSHRCVFLAPFSVLWKMAGNNCIK